MGQNKISFKGGDAMKKAIANARKAENIKGYDVGFFKDATYPTGESVAGVAATNEFGFGVPERPFFRDANDSVQEKLAKTTKSRLEGNKEITNALSSLLGLQHQNEVQLSIERLKDPPNTESTIKAKKGKDNPLIDTGLMLRSVTHKLTE